MKSAILFLAMITLFSMTTKAQDAAGLRKKHFNLDNGIAIKGYDPVAYFTQNKNQVSSSSSARLRIPVFELAEPPECP